MQVPRIQQFHIVSEIVIAVFGDQPFEGGCEFIGRTETGDFAYEIFERNVGVGLDSACRVGVYPKQGLFLVVDDQGVGDENGWGLLRSGQFLPEIGAGPQTVLLVAVAGEHAVGLFLQTEHDHPRFFFHGKYNNSKITIPRESIKLAKIAPAATTPTIMII